MKITKLLAGSLAAVALGVGFTACSDDAPDSGKNNVVDRDQTRYLSVTVASPTGVGSRAFEDGLTSESEVKTLYFVFYDNQGNPTATMQQFAFDETQEGWSPDNGNDNVTKFWKSVVPVNMVQGQNIPSYVMCYVNPIDQKDLATMPLSEIQTTVRQAVKSDNGFAMCNSVYYATDPITGKMGPMLATPITATQLFESEKAAQTAPDNQILNIYVERYAAKIGLTLEANKIEAVTIGQEGKGDGVATLKFVPTAWRPNAICTDFYPTKAFGLNPDENGKFNPLVTPTLDQMDKAFAGSGLTAWNDPTNFRCYWACSPSYFANKYPYVSDDVDDLDGKTQSYAVRYLTYDLVVDGDKASHIDKGIAWNNGFKSTDETTFFYSRETTTAIEAINNIATGNPVAAVPSVVIVGKYLVNGATDAETFYYDANNNVYYATEANAETALIARQNVVYTDQNGTLATSTNLFTVEHPNAAVRGDTHVAGRYVTLQLLEPTEGVNLYYWGNIDDAGNKGYVEITTENLAEVNRILWTMTGNFEIYSEGLAFFNIPVHHLGWDESRCVIEKGGSKVYDWEHLKRGDLGIVRNHVYNIEVTGITGRATGLRSNIQPIVPPKDDVNYYVAARLNILAWRVVPTQQVEL